MPGDSGMGQSGKDRPRDTPHGRFVIRRGRDDNSDLDRTTSEHILQSNYGGGQTGMRPGP